MLRPLPNLESEEAMAKLGRLSALRSAKLDALHQLRDAVTGLNSQNNLVDRDIELIGQGREALDRIEQIINLESKQ